VVEDLVKNTEIDKDNYSIKYPFHPSIDLLSPFTDPEPSNTIYDSFWKYLTERYGVPKYMIDGIMDSYEIEIINIINLSPTDGK